MNCERFQTAASELARGEIMDAEERREAMAHADDCRMCERTLLAQQELTIALSGLAAEMNALEAPPVVESVVVSALRDRTSRQLTIVLPARRYRAIAAVAAVLLLCTAIIAVQMLSVQQTELTQEQPVIPPVPVRAAPPSSFLMAAGLHGTTLTKPGILHASKRKSRRIEPLVARKDPAIQPTLTPREVATDFVPVGYGSALDLQFGARLVRVEMPRYALARFGLPMNVNRLDEKVKADVLVGNDGLARAIRFVNYEVR